MIEIVGTREIATRAKVKLGTVHQWSKRHPSFPAPFKTLATGPVWDWRDVRMWLSKTGRI